MGCRTQADELSLRTLSQLFEKPTRYEGQVITFVGIYQGWRPLECHFSALASQSITRSDWLFRVDNDCLYVTGGKPHGIDPMNSTDIGRRIELKGMLMRSNDGSIYVKYLDALLLDP